MRWKKLLVMMNNKCVYLGNFKPPHSTENGIKKGLEGIGWKVDTIQEDEINVRDVIERCKSARFVLWTRTWISEEGKIREIFENIDIPTAAVHLDLYLGISRKDRVGKDLFWLTDFCFTADGGEEHAKEFKKRGVNHHFLAPGVDKDGCYKGKPSGEYDGIDICFLGSSGYHKEYPNRPKLIAWLSKTYPNSFKHLGHDSNIWLHDKNKLFASVKIFIGDTLKSPRYTSDRLVEGGGRGAFMITPRIEGLKLYEDGVHCIEYEYFDYSGLKEKIDYYLDQPKERKRMVNNAIKHTLHNHTWEHRMKEMLGIMGLK